MGNLNIKYRTVKHHAEGNPQTVELSNDPHKANTEKNQATKFPNILCVYI